jgi:hypothetical protein
MSAVLRDQLGCWMPEAASAVRKTWMAEFVEEESNPGDDGRQPVIA